ncbi:hypothetical protein L596_018792 [Steinernema carpocapsae]|uniref:Uncharacterized protein n=1 Tax=Steinernema carpocapsae TaxID=34508 RepID=A0A4U5N5P3_STECR|nr:hypothetical protein L596_018792 [Steinernema carpocapsae]
MSYLQFENHAPPATEAQSGSIGVVLGTRGCRVAHSSRAPVVCLRVISGLGNPQSHDGIFEVRLDLSFRGFPRNQKYAENALC